ncbi:MAG: D-alanyl-D-alanine carboxypeptidase, partial [Methylobacter sp.]
SPPYQLDCGNGAAAHSIPATRRVNYAPKHKNISRIKTTNLRAVNKAQPKTISRVKTSIKPINKNKIPPKTSITQAKAKSAIPQPVKSKNYHKTATAGKMKNTQKLALH